MNQSTLQYHFIGAGVSIVAVTYGFSRYVFGLFIPEIKADFGLSTEWMGVIANTSYLGFLIAMMVSSLMASTLGPRRTVVLGGCVAVVGLTILAFAHHPWMLALGVIIAGMSPGFSYPPYPMRWC